MKPVTLTRFIGTLIGVLFVISIVGWGAQENQIVLSERTQNLQPKAVRPTKLSDAERAEIFMARKSFPDAIVYYSRAISSYHHVTAQNRAKIASLWNKIGICYQQDLDYEKARKAYKKAVHMDRAFAQAWNNLGTTYYLKKRVKKSIKYYRHAIKLNPLSATYHLNLGTAYFTRRKYKKTFKQLQAAVELDPKILRQSSWKGTEVEARQAGARFYFYMAKVFASLGNASEAVEYLERAMEDGFNNRIRILRDPDMKKISKDPAFIALMKNPPVAIKN